MVQVGEHESDKIIFVKNFPQEMQSNLTVDCTFRATRIGTVVNSNGLPFEVWDYGKPHFGKIVTTNYPPQMEAETK